MSVVNHIELFPTIVGECERVDLIEPVNKLIKSIPENDWGYQGSLSTDVLDDNLKREFCIEVKLFLRNVLNYNQDIKLTTSWFTRRKPDTIANTHKHVNSWWSACYYLQDESEINLEKDIPQIYVNPTVWTRLNGLARTLKAKKGTLLVFPSYVLHTPVLHEKNLRYSLAMNFMPLGIVGEGDSTYEYR